MGSCTRYPFSAPGRSPFCPGGVVLVSVVAVVLLWSGRLDWTDILRPLHPALPNRVRQARSPVRVLPIPFMVSSSFRSSCSFSLEPL